ncbi:MAG: hypothetical protein MOIL_00282 [Candidatus Methanolliviera sp. GoM_oil]|nr:MAG: hypothetical protein MOIL_00282 [Candidatus Methanolliviera sp. GoM_oil]
MDELKKIIAKVFLRKRRQITRSEFIFALSYDLRWFSKKEAEKIFEVSVRENLLEDKEGVLRTKFDFYRVDLPHDFKPEPDFDFKSKSKEEKSLDVILKRIMKEKKIDEKEAMAEINKTQEDFQGLISMEVSALLVARDMGVDIDDVLERYHKELVEKRLKSI